MKQVYVLTNLPDSLRGGAVSIGKFDGVHVGHLAIIERLKYHAKRVRGPAVLVTFDPLPRQVLQPEKNFRPLCTLERKIELLTSLEPDALIVIPTDKNFLKQTAETFFYETLKNQLDAKMVVEGSNFSFGRDRIGTVEAMKLYGQWNGVEIDIIEPIPKDGDIVSSSRIRHLLLEGQIERANQWMALPYRLTGKVISGEQRGRTLDFPTANLGETKTVIPKHGVYAALAHFDEETCGITTRGATVHVGSNPTFGENATKIEVFLHDFSGDVYGKQLHVDFLAFLRDLICFETPQALIEQMNQDVERSRSIVATPR